MPRVKSHVYQSKLLPPLRTRMEVFVTLQQVVEGEICRVVLGPLPEPCAVALDNQCHGNQLLGVIYSGDVDEASLWVNLMDKVRRGFGKHHSDRREGTQLKERPASPALNELCRSSDAVTVSALRYVIRTVGGDSEG